MPAHGWPEAFVRVLGQDDILRESYLFSVFDNGQTYCKACGGFVTDNRADHMDFHRQELDLLYNERREAAKVAREAGQKAARVARQAQTVEHGPECPCKECQEAF